MPVSKQELLEKINQHTWYHNIDLGNGVVTPGRNWDFIWEPSAKFMEKEDFSGKNVLEIGTWDGYFSFKAEALGAAKVIATDIKPWETFQLAKEILNSKVEFRHASIYSLDEVFPEERFDIVVCYGIFYHLLYPMLGFTKLNKVLKAKGTLLLEGAYYLKFQDRSLFYFSYGEDRLVPDDPTFCTCPTLKCLKNMLNASFFEVEEQDPYLRKGNNDFGRVLVMAKKRDRNDNDLLYEHTYPEDIILPKRQSSRL